MWQEGWAAASEIINPVAVFEAKAGGCGGKCAKTAAIETARELKWSADELVKILKALGS